MADTCTIQENIEKGMHTNRVDVVSISFGYIIFVITIRSSLFGIYILLL